MQGAQISDLNCRRKHSLLLLRAFRFISVHTKIAYLTKCISDRFTIRADKHTEWMFSGQLFGLLSWYSSHGLLAVFALVGTCAVCRSKYALIRWNNSTSSSSKVLNCPTKSQSDSRTENPDGKQLTHTPRSFWIHGFLSHSNFISYNISWRIGYLVSKLSKKRLRRVYLTQTKDRWLIIFGSYILIRFFILFMLAMLCINFWD